MRKELIKKVFNKAKRFILYWIVQITLPVLSFFLSEILPKQFHNFKSLIITLAFLLPLFILLIHIIFFLRKELGKNCDDLKIYKAVFQSIAFEKEVLDEYHHIKKVEGAYKIKGSDVWVETRLQGVNVHPEGKSSKEIRILSSSDVENYRFAVQIYDNIRKRTVEPDSIKISPNTIVNKIYFPETKVGEPIDFTIKKFWAGGVIEKREYVYSIFRHLLRGIDYYRGTILFDRAPLSYYPTTIDEKGEIKEIDVGLKGKNIHQDEFCFRLEWESIKPPNIIIINFIIPNPHLNRAKRKNFT